MCPVVHTRFSYHQESFHQIVLCFNIPKIQHWLFSCVEPFCLLNLPQIVTLLVMVVEETPTGLHDSISPCQLRGYSLVKLKPLVSQQTPRV